MIRRTLVLAMVCGSLVGPSFFASTRAEEPVSFARDIKPIFESNCSACHNANGSGQSGVFPPLAGNPMVTGSPDKVIAAVKNGLTGQTTVNGKSYNGSMPAWKSKLSDAEIADVITYIRSSWGNKADAVTEAQVAGLK